MTFNFFAADDIFGIRVGKVQEGWWKFPILGADVFRCGIQLIDWLG